MSEESYRRAFKLDASCLNQCMKNRETDPFCLCGLEEKATTPGTTVEKESKDGGQKVAIKREIPMGLVNLGNTCYLNSFLQTLFRILPIRRVLYAWRLPPENQRAPGVKYDVVQALQRLLARMQMAEDKACTPREFVSAVGVNVARQNDVQEFMIVFLDWVDIVIAERKGEEKLQSMFIIQCKSVVRCRECKNESKSDTKLSDLGVPTEKLDELHECLKTFFKEEQIDDYACDRCAKKSVADKGVQMVELPRFLNVHLHRFTFDKKTHQRSKLIHGVKFPSELDLRPYLTKEQADEWGEDGCTFELFSILLHCGTADGGHYLARIRSDAGQWWTFDDDQVTRYEFTEGNKEDSESAYMLVYEKKRDVERSPTVPPIPEWIDINSKDRICRAQLRFIRASFQHAGMQNWTEHLRVKGHSSSITWLPTPWLGTVFRTLKTGKLEQAIESPNMKPHMCPHSMVADLRGLKAVDGIQMSRIFGALGAPPKPVQLSGDYCRICTKKTIPRETNPKG